MNQERSLSIAECGPTKKIFQQEAYVPGGETRMLLPSSGTEWPPWRWRAVPLSQALPFAEGQMTHRPPTRGRAWAKLSSSRRVRATAFLWCFFSSSRRSRSCRVRSFTRLLWPRSSSKGIRGTSVRPSQGGGSPGVEQALPTQQKLHPWAPQLYLRGHWL